jgi:ATP-dependent helicase HepA
VSGTGRFHPGQRWISVGEPELGLGEIRAIGRRTVTIYFPATQESREYAATDDAPIRRAAFRAGDTILTRKHRSATVDRVEERHGLLYYHTAGDEIAETELSHTLSFNSPLERLFAGQFDPPHHFDLRTAALEHHHRRRQSTVRGFVGGRIDLLPHQLGIAAEVSSRLLPRVLLADEVGLGKTIEACMIVHRLLLTGRVRRVLVVVPESLVHQWFLELLRRFNLWFHIFNEARCAAIEDANPGANPFLDDQLVLCELPLFTGGDHRLQQAVDAHWDIVVVDEAHHLEWMPASTSTAYAAVEQLASVSPGLLLLTATPEQLGVAGHFARLRLLDPDRFHDLDTFIREAEGYRSIEEVVRALESGQPLTDQQMTMLAPMAGETGYQAAGAGPDEAVRASIVERLIDQHGTGRVMFRNTRASIGGFLPRSAHVETLPVNAEAGTRKALALEWAADIDPARPPLHRGTLSRDPRIDWLLSLLRDVAPDKVLLICHTPGKAVAIQSALEHRTTIPTAAFHEGLTLLQRDRAAASFADPEGVRLLVCSEIGSEGRNFQFAHHLALFDLPLDPALLEQRIGRLDRIGQRSAIQIHVPVVPGTHLEVLARWYGEALDAFEQQVPGSRELLDRFSARLRELTVMPTGRSHPDREAALTALLDDARRARREIAVSLEEGRDRLLERQSFKRVLAAGLIAEISRQDSDRSLDDFMLDAFDLFMIEVEEIAARTYRIGSAGVLVDEFPGLGADGLTATTDRARALAREDLQFLTWDHPLATGAIDLLLASERGNCAFVRWVDAEVSALYLDAVFVLESLAPASLHVDRFLPPTPIRVAVDHRGREASTPALDVSATMSSERGGRTLLARPDVREKLLPALVERAKAVGDSRAPAIVDGARRRMRQTLEYEASRLRNLQRVNRLVRDEEIAALVDQQRQLDEHLATARLRLDAVRLIYRGPDRRER